MGVHHFILPRLLYTCTVLPFDLGEKFFPSELPLCFFFYVLSLCWLSAFRSFCCIWPGAKWKSALKLWVSFSNTVTEGKLRLPHPLLITILLQNMTLHPSPITCEFLFSTALISPKMCLSHLENMPLSHSRTQGAQRSSWKLWLFCSIAIFLFLCSFSWLIFIFLQLEVRRQLYLRLLFAIILYLFF